MVDYGYVVVKVRESEGSRLYKLKDGMERRAIPNSLSILAASKVQIVTLSDPETYGEYKPYSIINTARELFSYVLELSPN